MRQGRVVVVTGAGGGIGSKVVNRFLGNGDTVIGLDRSASSIEGLKESAFANSRLSTFVADIVQPVDVRKFLEYVEGECGRIDVLVNCAGFFPVVPFEKMTVAEWDEVIAINLTGAFHVTHTLLPLMKKTGWGRVINIGSASIFEGVVGQSHYVAAKAGLMGLTRSLAMELGQYGITVNIVAPGLTLTDPVRRTLPKQLIDAQREVRALQRDEVPEDLAGPVFLLASPDADFISGQLLVVDGGKVKH